jgi:hypothetical protein
MCSTESIFCTCAGWMPLNGFPLPLRSSASSRARISMEMMPADAAAVAGEQFALAAGFLKFVVVAHGVRLGPDQAMRVLSVGRYGRGLPGWVSLWPNSRCQKVGDGWGRGL